MASEIRVNKINNRAGLGTITIADTGVVVNGIVTCTEISGLNALNIAGVSTFASPLDINGDIDVDGHTNLDNLSVAGVATFSSVVNATSFTGNLTGNVSGTTAVFDDFLNIGSNIKLGNAGVITATSYRGDGSQLTGIVAGLSTISGVVNVANDLNVDGHTNLDNVSIAGVTTFTEDIYLRDDKYIYLGNDTPGNDAKIYFDEYNLIVQNSNTSGQTYIRGTTTRLDAGDTSSGFQLGVRCRKVNSNLITEIYGGSTRRILTTNSGVVVTGIMTATSFSGDGSSLSNLPAGAPVGGASTNTVFFENDKAVAVNYQITSTKNAMSAGPIAINAGIAVTVPSGCSWTIV